MDVRNKRNFILLGHAQSGKTTLAESILYSCKAVTRKGRTEDGTTAGDYSFDEIERKSSINLSLLFCEYKGVRIQILDTPGYADFFGEVLAGARAVDGAVIVVDASSGVEVGTERAWQIAEEAGLPCIIFLNKIDKEGVDRDKALSELKSRLSKNCVMIKSLEDPDLMEAVAESSDSLLEKYLEVMKLSQDEIKAGLLDAVIKRKLFPVVEGSALADKGITDLLDEVLQYLPDPLQRISIKGLVFSDSAPFSAFVFKNISDPYVGQLTLLRIFSGTLTSGSGFYNASKKVKERIGSLYFLQGKEQRAIDSAGCGDIIAIAKLKDTAVSDSLSTEKAPFLFEPISFPEAAISASVKPHSREDEEKISDALHKLALEDPAFKISHDPQT
ncbi:MAG: GTP-binding protein, partial [Candidatus Omnitrophota bacterium]